jgi:two-component system response regulator AdeR
VPIDVLVVEDDPVLREVLTLHLQGAGYDVRPVSSGDEALDACAVAAPDVVVLDLSLPGKSGLEVCTALRASLDPTPGVLIVTARASEADVMLGFDAGADDYVVKPCRPREVVARVAALLRRVRPSVGSREIIRRGELTVDVDAMRARFGATALELTPTEFALLAALARAPDVVHARKALLASIWSSSHEGYLRNVDCHVTRLRRKLEAAGATGPLIETVHGVGYRWSGAA